MELTIKLNLLDLAEAENQLDKARAILAQLRRPTGENRSTVDVMEEDVAIACAVPAVDDMTLSLKQASASSRVFEDLLLLIQKNGKATLAEVAQAWNVDTKTIRGHLLNGLRSLKHRNQLPPFDSQWSADLHCVIYTARTEN